MMNTRCPQEHTVRPFVKAYDRYGMMALRCPECHHMWTVDIGVFFTEDSNNLVHYHVDTMVPVSSHTSNTLVSDIETFLAGLR